MKSSNELVLTLAVGAFLFIAVFLITIYTAG